MIEVRLLDDAGVFLAEAGPMLLSDEARHNLIFGVAGTIHASPTRYGEKRFWLAVDGGEVVAAAMQTPPYNLILARPRDDAAISGGGCWYPATEPSARPLSRERATLRS